MPRLHAIALLVALALGLAGGPTAASADDKAYKVIVHPDSTVSSVSRELLRRIYLKKQSGWGDGRTARPIDLDAKTPVRDRFTRGVLKKSPSQLRAYWNAQIFSGKGTPPPVAKSTTAAIKYVLANPGAVAYIPADADPGGCRVIEID
jgi:hypothetical protein